MPQPYVHIQLDKPRKLRFRHNDLADMELDTGKGFKELLSTQEFHGARVLLSYGLRWEEKRGSGMTPTVAGNLIQDHWFAKGKTLDELGLIVEDALRRAGILRDGKPIPEDDDDPNASAEVPAASAST